MRRTCSIELLRRVMDATPKTLKEIERVLDKASAVGGDRKRVPKNSGWQGEAKGKNTDEIRGGEIVAVGRLRYRPGFEDVWLGDTHYDLRARTKARLCIQYLVEKKALDASSARHLIDEIDPYVRREGDFTRAADIKIDHYFSDHKGRLPKLRKDLIAAAGRNGRYFLKVK